MNFVFWWRSRSVKQFSFLCRVSPNSDHGFIRFAVKFNGSGKTNYLTHPSICCARFEADGFVFLSNPIPDIVPAGSTANTATIAAAFEQAIPTTIESASVKATPTTIVTPTAAASMSSDADLKNVKSTELEIPHIQVSAEKGLICCDVGGEVETCVHRTKQAGFTRFIGIIGRAYVFVFRPKCPWYAAKKNEMSKTRRYPRFGEHVAGRPLKYNLVCMIGTALRLRVYTTGGFTPPLPVCETKERKFSDSRIIIPNSQFCFTRVESSSSASASASDSGKAAAQ